MCWSYAVLAPHSWQLHCTYVNKYIYACNVQNRIANLHLHICMHGYMRMCVDTCVYNHVQTSLHELFDRSALDADPFAACRHLGGCDTPCGTQSEVSLYSLQSGDDMASLPSMHSGVAVYT